jgi:hypothetical protein
LACGDLSGGLLARFTIWIPSAASIQAAILGEEALAGPGKYRERRK